MRTRITDDLDSAAEKWPDRVAISSSKNSLTFSELWQGALHVAEGLLERHIEKCPILIFMDKSVECIAAFYGVAYSRNFYTLMDILMPKERLQKIVSVLKPSLVITSAELLGRAEEIFGDVPVAVYEEFQKNSVEEERIRHVSRRVIDTDLLYVLFTSGSTGTPKGVTISHRAVMDYLSWVKDEFDLGETCVLGNQVSLYFDVSLQDIFLPAYAGCRTELLEASSFRFPRKLFRTMRERGVNAIFWVPSALCLLANLKGLEQSQLPPLEKILFAGEVMPNKQLNMWRRAFPRALFVNMYGPTEACDVITFYAVDRPFRDDEPLPIGIPCRNIDLMVLDEEGRPVKRGEAGELYLRGSALSYGYYNDPEQTEKAFVQNPLQKEYREMVYRTGDLVRYNTRGELEFLGRKDFQIKHMGYRIELGEIEAAALAYPPLEAGVALYDGKRGKICLYVTPKSVDGKALYEFLKQRLPHYMMPGIIEGVDAFPINSNGKIDRKKMREEFFG